MGQWEGRVMALIKTDWTPELDQIEARTGRILKSQVTPMVEGAIRQAGEELHRVVEQAGTRIEANIRVLSEEIHSHRTLTREDIAWVIDHAAERLGRTIDERMARLRTEATEFIVERTEQLKVELADAATRSKRTALVNVAIAACGAIAMGAVGIIYRHISMGQLDLFAVFRVLLLAVATGTGLWSILKLLSQWRTMNGVRRNVATIAIGHLSLLRPNGAVGSFAIALICVALWYFMSLHAT